MARPPVDQPDEPRPEADVLEQAVLGLLLDAHPAMRSIDEVVAELTAYRDDWARCDAIANALRDLTGAGLIHRHGRFVFATRAAVRAHELSP